MSDEKTTTEVSRLDAPYRAAELEDLEMIPGEGLQFETLPQIIEAAKLMARADLYLPKHARQRPDMCFAILLQTRDWGLRNPFYVAQHSYAVRARDGTETIAYDSAIHQAVLRVSQAIIGRPQYFYEGEGDERRCTVRVLDRETREWQEYVTPPLSRCRRDNGSPLWRQDPDQQLGYFGLRNLCRLKYQDVLAGFYDKDEFDSMVDVSPEPEPSPDLLTRLPGRIDGDGFTPDAGETERQEQAAQAKAAELKERRREIMAKARAAKETGRPRGRPRKAAPAAPGATGIQLSKLAQTSDRAFAAAPAHALTSTTALAPKEGK